nr:immunoglobulin heavy chain junction region [Macaca mulatta]MOX60100.1 immunoglobulin heavy chain junction region [Macaca mulatta]MOX62980.1 immunoglobulin heavy chain junction region [Macaca mulatta]MOX68552.1 immunoglobulin heavy chain junction region [Macaca mulatta]
CSRDPVDCSGSDCYAFDYW